MDGQLINERTFRLT